MSINEKVLCICHGCSAELAGHPGDTCPGCEKGKLKESSMRHVSIEEDNNRGMGPLVLVIHKSADPLAGRYCSLHQTQE